MLFLKKTFARLTRVTITSSDIQEKDFITAMRQKLEQNNIGVGPTKSDVLVFKRRFVAAYVVVLVCLICSSSSKKTFAQFPMNAAPLYNEAQFGSPEYSSVPFISSSPNFIDGQFFENGQFYPNVPIPFDSSLVNPLPISSGPQFSTSIPQTGTEVIGADGSNYTILGDITGALPFGSGNFDNIPFLNEGTVPKTQSLPTLKVPQNTKELGERTGALLKRFSCPKLTILQSTPSRLLRYSLIGGVDETFLAPSNNNSNNAKGINSSSVQNDMRPMYALGALCWNVPCANRQVLQLVNNRPSPKVGFGFQSQRGELLACLAFAKVDRNYELQVEGKKFSVQDLVEWEKYSCSSYTNLSLVAVGLSHYLQNPDETWVNQFGEQWSLVKILDHEAKRNIDWSAADSTDKLLAFAYLLARLKQSRNANSPDLAPVLKRTEIFLLSMKRRILDSMENESGLCETLFFNPNVKLSTPYMKLYVNGKILRWLSAVSSQDELNSPRMQRACMELCALVDQLFNSVDDLDQVSSIDEESFSIALQTLSGYCAQLGISTESKENNAETSTSKEKSK